MIINYKEIFYKLIPLIQSGVATEKQNKMASKLAQWIENDRENGR